jgi:hypothetical protein
MDVDPAGPSAVELAGAHKINEFCRRYGTREAHFLVRVEKLFPATFIADEKFAEHEFVPGDFVVYK